MLGKRKVVIGSLMMVLLVGVALSSLQAATVVWTDGGADTDWSTSGNWSAVPTASDRAAIAASPGYGSVDVTITQTGEVAGSVDIGKGTADLSGTVTMTGGTLGVSSTSTGHLEIGGVGTGVFTQSGGTVTVELNTTLGSASGSGSGEYNLSGTGVLNVRNLNVGYSATGEFNHNLGGSSTINASSQLYVGYNSGAQGDFNISTGSTANFDGGATIGYSGTGILNQSGGDFNTEGDIYIGFSSGATGTCTLTGGTWTIDKTSGKLVVGKAGTGTLNIGYTTAATTITETASSTTDLYIGYDSGSTGMLEGWGTIDLSGNIYNNGKIIANGYDTERTLNISNMTRLFNQHSATSNGNGLYAIRKGKLSLPSITVATDTQNYMWGDNLYDSTPEMVNATRLSLVNSVSGSYSVELLAVGRSDVTVSLNANAKIIGVWKYSTTFGAPGSGTTVTMRYDDSLASTLGITEADLQIYQLIDGKWKNVTSSINTTNKTITGSTDSLTTFAVGVDLEGISLGWYSLSFYYSFDSTYTSGMTDEERIARWRAPLVEAAKEGWDYVMVYGPYNYTNYTIDGEKYDLEAFMDEADALGVKVLVDIGTDGGVPSDTQITTVVNDVKNHPALYGYYLIDEPEMREGSPYYVTAADCVDAYNLLKSLDPTKPVHITMSDSIMDNSDYLDAADIVAKELYNSDHWDEVEDDIDTLESEGKPFVITPRIYKGGAAYSLTLPTAEEFQYNIFAPIIMGAIHENAGGVLPFLFQGYDGWQRTPPTDKEFREKLCYPTTRVVQEIEPHLKAGANSGCTFSWVGTAPSNFKTLVLGEDDDDVVLIVINDGTSAATPSFKVTGIDSTITEAKRLDPSRVVLGTNGEIASQYFAPKEVKIYRLQKP